MNKADYLFKISSYNKKNNKYNFAIFIDRDGVIINDKHYLKNPNKIEFIDGSLEALRFLNNKQVFIAVISNQAGIAKGIIKMEDFLQVNDKFLELLNFHSVKINCLMFCPFYEGGSIVPYNIDSDLRKPNTGMYQFIHKTYGLSNEQNIMIGDKKTDIEFGVKISAINFLVKTGYGLKEINKISKKNQINFNYKNNLLESVQCIKF